MASPVHTWVLLNNADADPTSPVDVRAAVGGDISAGSASVTYTLPSGLVAGDWIGFFSTTTATNTGVTSAPAGFSVVDSTAFGTAARSFVVGQYTSGTSLTLTHANTPGTGSVYAIVVLNGTTHPNGFGTVGTVTTRGATIGTNTAVAAGTSPTPCLVVSHEKASTHSTVTATPSTITLVEQHNAASSGASVYVGSYDTSAGTADRTITYSTTSANGAAYQVPVLVGAPTINAAGSADGSSSASGALSALLVAAAVVAGVSGVTGAPTATLKPTGTTAAVSALQGAPTAVLGASGTVAASASTTGSVTAKAAASGQVAASSSDSGSASLLLAVAGTAAGTSAASGNPQPPGTNGAVAGISGTSGAVTVRETVAGAVVAATGVVGNVMPPSIRGTIVGTSSGAGAVTGRLASAGASPSGSGTAGSLTARTQAAGGIIGTTTNAGSPTATYRTTGEVTATTGTTGTVAPSVFAIIHTVNEHRRTVIITTRPRRLNTTERHPDITITEGGQ